MATAGSRYISVMAPPASGPETITFRFSQFNVLEGQFDIPVAGIATTMSELEIAQIIRDAFETYFAATDDGIYQYNKLPGFSRDGYPPFTFVTTLCDHVIHIWSQVGFKITVNPESGDSDPAPETTPAPSTLLKVSDIPIFSTIAEAMEIGESYGQAFLAPDGSALTHLQILNMLSIGSQQVIRFLNGMKVVASTYEQQVRGNYKLGYKFDRYPVLYEDRPVVRGPYFSILTNQSDIAPIVNYDIDYEDGMCSFPNYGSWQRQPLDINNYLGQTYVAGYANVPEVCKQEAVHVTTFLKYNPAFKSLKQGSFQVVYRDLLDVQNEIQSNLNAGLGR